MRATDRLNTKSMFSHFDSKKLLRNSFPCFPQKLLDCFQIEGLQLGDAAGFWNSGSGKLISFQRQLWLLQKSTVVKRLL